MRRDGALLPVGGERPLARPPGSRVAWRWTDAGGAVLSEGVRPVDIAADSSRKLEDLAWAPPGPGRYELVAEVVTADGSRYDNGYRFTVE